MTSTNQFKSIDEYIDTFPDDVQKTLQTLRKTIKNEIKEVEEVISYNMPAFRQNCAYVIYFAAWKKHISLYPFSSLMEKSIKGASVYKTSGKGTIQFPIDKPLPFPLIREIVQFRLKEVLGSKKI